MSDRGSTLTTSAFGVILEAGIIPWPALIDHPDVYRTGIASAPGFDAYDYFIHEPYFGGCPGPDNTAAYIDASLFEDATGLTRPLMIVAGTSDIGPWQNAVKMTDTLLKAGVDHDFVMLPDETHGYGAKQEAYFINKLVRHFGRELKPDRGHR